MGQIDGMGPLDQVTYFIDGLKPATKMEVSYQAPETFEEAWTLAIKYDTAMYGSGKPNMPSYQPPQHKSYQSLHRPSRNFASQSTPMELDQAETRRKYYQQEPERKEHVITAAKLDISPGNVGANQKQRLLSSKNSLHHHRRQMLNSSA